jgi:hypothetical protein
MYFMVDKMDMCKGVLSMRKMMQRFENRRESRRNINDDICLPSACHLFYGGLDGRCSEHARDDAEIPLKPSPHLPSYPAAYL